MKKKANLKVLFNYKVTHIRHPVKFISSCVFQLDEELSDFEDDFEVDSSVEGEYTWSDDGIDDEIEKEKEKTKLEKNNALEREMEKEIEKEEKKNNKEELKVKKITPSCKLDFSKLNKNSHEIEEPNSRYTSNNAESSTLKSNITANDLSPKKNKSKYENETSVTYGSMYVSPYSQITLKSRPATPTKSSPSYTPRSLRSSPSFSETYDDNLNQEKGKNISIDSINDNQTKEIAALKIQKMRRGSVTRKNISIKKSGEILESKSKPSSPVNNKTSSYGSVYVSPYAQSTTPKSSPNITPRSLKTGIISNFLIYNKRKTLNYLPLPLSSKVEDKDFPLKTKSASSTPRSLQSTSSSISSEPIKNIVRFIFYFLFVFFFNFNNPN